MLYLTQQVFLIHVFVRIHTIAYTGPNKQTRLAASPGCTIFNAAHKMTG